ncbi:Rrf2 family transcriptional regulator [Variovorax sp. J22R133]|uniref:Rrf2 family transcriptional regulator n=1 Tax=Variovorax brevis TaxID=3053503 RepID=UPI002578AEAC|nr:Rrf2 family transcriptional regulator [Variovorax sp. J22R133]MDM0112031.1 Rrf2 family transcriptional regulator [Variovorax sp. J22R133]
MRLTTKGRQAVVAMIDVALQQRSGPVALAGISRRRHMSMSYLEQMFTDLRRHGLVQSTRGPGGGYKVARPLEAISVADIVSAVDSAELDVCRELGADIRPTGQRCLTPELWTSLGQRVLEFLASVTLQSLVDEQRAANVQPEVQPAQQATTKGRRVKSLLPQAPNSVFQLGMFLPR